MLKVASMLKKHDNSTLLLCTAVIGLLFTEICSAGTFETILSQQKQTKTRFSILAVDANSGQVVFQLNPETPMIPASNMKLLSTAAALHYLGKDYTFKTQVGVLGNDLIIVGNGDPLLADPKYDTVPGESTNRLMAAIISAMNESGVKTVDNIIVDTSFFDNNRVHPSWPAEQLNQWYACEVSGLNFYNNCVHITTERKSGKAVLVMEPANSYITLVNQLKLISSGSSAVGAYRNSVPNKLLIKGNLNQQAGFDVAIENPAGFFVSVLKDHLMASGIPVKGNLIQKYVKNEPGIRYLTVLETPIANVLKRANTDSLGLTAECLVKTISAENTEGRINGEWAHGLDLVSRYLQSLGIPDTQYTLDDGSGLSRKNKLSAKALVAILDKMCGGENADVFISSLAVGGEEGTIAKYFGEEPYRNNIHGKTGYIDGVRAFSGICKTPRGDILCSILTENGNGNTRACINDITKALFDGKL